MGGDMLDGGFTDGAISPVGGHVAAPRIRLDLSTGIVQTLRGLLPRLGELPDSDYASFAFDDVYKKALPFESLHFSGYERIMQDLPRFRSPIRHISGYLLVVGLTTMNMIGTKDTFSTTHHNLLNDGAVGLPGQDNLPARIAALNNKIGLQDRGLVQSVHP